MADEKSNRIDAVIASVLGTANNTKISRWGRNELTTGGSTNQLGIT